LVIGGSSVALSVATRSYRRIAGDHRVPLARYGAIEGALRERHKTNNLHHHLGHDLEAIVSEPQPEYVEVFRKAHELEHAHGANAFTYAVRKAERALAAGEMDEHAFWNAVAASLKPR
jgi:hypothetical protein